MGRDEGGASPAPTLGVPGSRAAGTTTTPRLPGTPAAGSAREPRPEEPEVAGSGSPREGEAPPFGGSWRRLYLLVLANLGFWTAVMAALTWAYQ